MTVQDPNTEFLEFYVSVPSIRTQKVRALSSDACRVIMKLFPGQVMTLVHEGVILDLNASFAYYGVKSADVVVALDISDVGHDRVNHWLRVTRSSDHFQEMIQGLMNVTTRKQVLRIRDFAWAKVETNPRRLRRMMTSFQQSNPFHDVHPRERSVIAEPAMEPSTAPLTAFWEQ
jgi:hypothetical protein